MICAVDKGLLVGKEADLSILTRHTHKTDRAGSSTIMVESNAMSEGLAEAEWVTSWLYLARDFRYELRDRHTLNREIRVTTIMEQNPDLDIITMTDAKSLYDCLNREQFASTEKRAALEIAVIRDSLESLGGQCRWFPHELNPTDGLTKLKGNIQPLLHMMKTAKLRITGEKEEMERRKAYRLATGKRNPRPKMPWPINSRLNVTIPKC